MVASTSRYFLSATALCCMVFWEQRTEWKNEDLWKSTHSSDAKRKSYDNITNCEGKEQLVDIILKRNSSLNNESTSLQAVCQSLPTWKEVVDLYGEKPIIFGLDTCKAYRQSLKGENGTDLSPQPRVAGMMNTGTHALTAYFNANFGKKSDYIREYQVGCGGKHASLKQKAAFVEKGHCRGLIEEGVMPIVTVRDPYSWMVAMCKLSYGLSWERGVNMRCPNLVRSSDEERQAGASTFNVTISDMSMNFSETSDSLVDYWNYWNGLYFNATFPRLMIRMEDLIYHTDEVYSTIRTCIGAPATVDDKIVYISHALKHSKRSDNFYAALAKSGREQDRYGGLSSDDYDYLKSHLNMDLMRQFQYKVVTRYPGT